MKSKRIGEAIKSVVRIASARASHCPVTAEDLLYLPNVQGDETETFYVDDDMQLSSLIDKLTN